MNIYFGLQLDGVHEAGTGPTLGEVVCGPKGLLDILELRLGLRARGVPEVQRVGQYLELLRSVPDLPSRFFAASLKVDGFAVATELLGWRDALVESGWDGNVGAAGVASRLQDLSSVEALASGRLSPGWGERLRAVQRELQHASPRLGNLRVHEPAAFLPKRLRNMLVSLGASFGIGVPGGASPGTPSGGAGDLTCDLERLREALMATTAEPSRFEGDASLELWEAFSEVGLARGVAQAVAASVRQGRSVAVIAGDGATVLEDAFRAEGFPAMGLHPRSSARPIPQLLGVVLRLLWEPVDPRAMLEFLAHPVSPVPGLLRWRLARALVESPGVGGRRWQEAIAEAGAEASKRYAADPEALAKQLARMKAAVGDWLETPRFSEDDGADVVQVVGVCRRLARWGAAMAEVADRPEADAGHYRALAAMASGLADLMPASGRIRRAQLETLLREAGGAGVARGDGSAELGGVWRVLSPGALLGRHDLVVWWAFHASDLRPATPWTLAERENLVRMGVEWPSEEVAGACNRLHWAGVVQATAARLILACPRSKEGEPTKPHPFLSRIRAVQTPDARMTLVDVDQAAGTPVGTVSSPPVGTEVGHRDLPRPRRWWRLASPLLPREEESYSSLEKFVYGPHEWVLRYPARLKPGPLSEMRLVDGSRQAGNLLDSLLDRWLSDPLIDWRTCTPGALDSWIAGTWPGLLREEGANLLLPGGRSLGAGLLETARRAFRHLRELFAAAGIRTATAHRKLDPLAFEGVRLGGILDLEVVDASGRTCILDLKFGGRKTREKELKENRALQLAVYAVLWRHAAGAAPAVVSPATGFYILRDRLLLPGGDGFWSSASGAQAPAAGATAACWDDFLDVWRWRRDQLKSGWVEVTAVEDDTAVPAEGQPLSVPPHPDWQAGEERAKYNDFAVLCGWPQNA